MDFQHNFKTFPNIPVVLSKESQTVPDMSFTPREIIAKFSRGEKVPLGFSSRFDYEDDATMEALSADDPDVFVEEPTRDPDFDAADYVEEMHALKERNQERQRQNELKVNASSQRKASDEEMSASDPTKRETTSGEEVSPPTAKPKE